MRALSPRCSLQIVVDAWMPPARSPADLLACGTMMFAMGDRAELVDRARHRVGRSAAT
jgi:hypothetical protein